MIAKTKRVADYKQLTTALPTLRYVDPERVYLSLSTDRAKNYEMFVEEGENVKLGQIIGERDGGYFKQPIYSSISGEVEGTKKMMHPSGIEVDVVIIRNDFKDELHETITDRPDSVIENMSKEEIINVLKEKAIVGLGGSGFPTYIKLNTDKPIDTVVINAVECEPYLSSDYRLIKDQPEDIFRGLKYVMHAMKAKKGVIAVKKTKKELIEVLERELSRFKDLDIEIAAVKDYYPQGWENETIKSAIGVEVPVGTLPMELGVLVFNVSTTAQIFEALKHNLPITKRHVTVNGDAINFPQNIRTRIGASVKDLIRLSDGFVEGVEKVDLVIGGPMMGTSVTTEDVLVNQTVTSVLALKSEEFYEEPCVRCGSCIYSCPVDIQPVNIMNAYKRGDEDALQNLQVDKCIECGLCAYVCTSKIHLTDYMRKGKKFLKNS